MSPRRHHRGVINAAAVAEMLGHSTPWFYGEREKLEAAGFPKKDELLGGWLRAAVQAWLDRRAGVVVESAPDAADEAELLRRAREWGKPKNRASAA